MPLAASTITTQLPKKGSVVKPTVLRTSSYMYMSRRTISNYSTVYHKSNIVPCHLPTPRILRRRSTIFLATGHTGHTALTRATRNTTARTMSNTNPGKPVDNVRTTSVKGEFLRHDSKHRVSALREAGHAPTPGRYHLHVSLACPWAAGTLSML